MPDHHSSDEQEILSLEDRRYEAVLRSDFDAFAELCHEDLVYAHSNGERDDLRATSTSAGRVCTSITGSIIRWSRSK